MTYRTHSLSSINDIMDISSNVKLYTETNKYRVLQLSKHNVNVFEFGFMTILMHDNGYISFMSIR